MADDRTTNPPPEPSLAESPSKRERIGFLAPASILLFIALTLAGTYCVRKIILERHMVAAMQLDDVDTMMVLAGSWPSPLNARDEDGATPLHLAAFTGRSDLARRLLSRGADVNAKDSLAWTPLHYAAQQHSKELTELLIAVGADVNARNSLGRSPLHVAVQWGADAIVEFLAAKGADLAARDHEGRTPLALVVETGLLPEMSDLLRKLGAKE
jgi:ankyrin repeat protein